MSDDHTVRTYDPQDDIVRRLHYGINFPPSDWVDNIFRDALHEIERLRSLAFTAYSEGFTHGTCKMPFSSWDTSQTKRSLTPSSGQLSEEEATRLKQRWDKAYELSEEEATRLKQRWDEAYGR